MLTNLNIIPNFHWDFESSTFIILEEANYEVRFKLEMHINKLLWKIKYPKYLSPLPKCTETCKQYIYCLLCPSLPAFYWNFFSNSCCSTFPSTQIPLMEETARAAWFWCVMILLDGDFVCLKELDGFYWTCRLLINWLPNFDGTYEDSEMAFVYFFTCNKTCDLLGLGCLFFCSFLVQS